MVEKLFIQILNMSLTGSAVILAVMLARLALKRAPRAISYALWSVALLRLICPVTLPGAWGMPVRASPIPADIARAEAPHITTGIPFANDLVNAALPAAAPGAETAPLQTGLGIARAVWLAGVAAMAVYSAVSLLRLRRRLVGAVRLCGRVYLADRIGTPFVLGLIRPKIYLPSSLDAGERAYVIAHEEAHIRRLDPAVKILAFAVLSVHWFNPLVWAAFALCMRDMEGACDERALRHADGDTRAAYSAALLHLAAGRQVIAGTPLAFGEGSVRGRVRRILRYRRPGLWLTLPAALAAVLLGIWLLTGPGADPRSPGEGYYASDKSEMGYPTSLVLMEEQQFMFQSITWSTYAMNGPYRQAGDRLICDTQDGRFTYVFRIKGDRLVFRAKESTQRAAVRWEIPDGTVYKYARGLPGIVPEGLDVPEAVLALAKSVARGFYSSSQDNFPEYAYTDWRIKSLERVYTYELDGLTLEIYQMDFRLRSEAPEKIVLAGGMFIEDENWVCIDYPNSRFFAYDPAGDVCRAALFENDCAPGDEIFTADLRAALSQ